MTLCVGIATPHGPFMISDTVTTIYDKNRNVLPGYIPSASPLEGLKAERLDTLKSKVFIVEDRVIVGFAGTLSEISNLIEDIKYVWEEEQLKEKPAYILSKRLQKLQESCTKRGTEILAIFFDGSHCFFLFQIMRRRMKTRLAVMYVRLEVGKMTSLEVHKHPR